MRNCIVNLGNTCVEECRETALLHTAYYHATFLKAICVKSLEFRTLFGPTLWLSPIILFYRWKK